MDHSLRRFALVFRLYYFNRTPNFDFRPNSLLSFTGCTKVYTKSSHLKAHQRIHTGEWKHCCILTYHVVASTRERTLKLGGGASVYSPVIRYVAHLREARRGVWKREVEQSTFARGRGSVSVSLSLSLLSFSFSVSWSSSLRFSAPLTRGVAQRRFYHM